VGPEGVGQLLKPAGREARLGGGITVVSMPFITPLP
jgi:hypothetical protein